MDEVRISRQIDKAYFKVMLLLVKILYYELWWDISGGHSTHLTDTNKDQMNINQASHLVSIGLILHSFSIYP